MLTLVRNTPALAADRLKLASAHLQAAIVHINNAAQSRMDVFSGDPRQVDELRLVVVALAEIINALEDAAATPDSQERPSLNSSRAAARAAAILRH